jgi:hypothetical protein
MRRRAALIQLLVLTSCGKLLELPTDPLGGGPPADPNATFTRVNAEVLPNCTVIACHDPIGQQSGMILTPDRAYAMIVNVPSVENPSLRRIAPKDPANSYLYRKIVGAGITGDRMPLTYPPLSEAKLSLVRDWIRRGAPND